MLVFNREVGEDIFEKDELGRTIGSNLMLELDESSTTDALRGEKIVSWIMRKCLKDVKNERILYYMLENKGAEQSFIESTD